MFCGFLAFVAWAYVKDQSDLERIAAENGFDAEHTAAFKACDRQMSGRSLSLGGVTYSKVPNDICVCQTLAMVAVLRSGEYSSHRNVVNYLTDENDRRPLDPSQLKNPADPEGEFRRLSEHLRLCVFHFSLASDRRNREDMQRICQELEMQQAARRPSQCADLASGRL